ncbi:DUF2306 domain-containing protein [Rivibacter subsaxonicus]|uniref:Putative membrane protein n=1 Tax=Rivibacter subsaxonicus TaxID=457575 RepID=A0A4Q7W2R4_9BURK|nr:DUF2306 domain-containing protein [Rivibacter subsaxonicus]RZU03019.1 putative membrane protein [Rivibacter subsaxonicus]
MPAIAPVVAIHLACAIPALLLGPVALVARKGSRLHRAAGYGWVTLMLGAAISALFIHGPGLPTFAGFSPIHLLVPLTFGGIGLAIWRVAHGDVRGHRRSMRYTYFAGCVGAGLFALLPARWLGQLVWGQWLGLI